MAGKEIQRGPDDDEPEIGLLFLNESEICVLDIPVPDDRSNGKTAAKDS